MHVFAYIAFFIVIIHTYVVEIFEHHNILKEQNEKYGYRFILCFLSYKIFNFLDFFKNLNICCFYKIEF